MLSSTEVRRRKGQVSNPKDRTGSDKKPVLLGSLTHSKSKFLCWDLNGSVQAALSHLSHSNRRLSLRLASGLLLEYLAEP